jgi:hypothetical protein
MQPKDGIATSAKETINRLASCFQYSFLCTLVEFEDSRDCRQGTLNKELACLRRNLVHYLTVNDYVCHFVFSLFELISAPPRKEKQSQFKPFRFSCSRFSTAT